MSSATSSAAAQPGNLLLWLASAALISEGLAFSNAGCSSLAIAGVAVALRRRGVRQGGGGVGAGGEVYSRSMEGWPCWQGTSSIMA